MPKVLVVATSRKTRGGITSVIKAYENNALWEKYHCKWIETHRDGSLLIKLIYLVKGFVEYTIFLPFYDIVHLHTSEPPSAFRKSVFFMPLAKMFRKKIIVHFHSFSVDTTIKSKFKTFYHFLFCHADYVLVLSKYWKDEIERTFGCGGNVKVLYNPCTAEISTKQYNVQKQILYAGTLNARKGYKDLIKAFAKIAERHRDWSIVFAGNGEIEQAKSLAVSSGIGAQTLFLGWVRDDEKDKAFKECSIFCLPSYAEGFPMGVLDAWAYGKPVITTPVGGIPDVAVNNKNCLLFESGDVDMLAAAMENLISNEKLKKDLEKESAILSKRFSINTISDTLNNIYVSLIKE